MVLRGFNVYKSVFLGREVGRFNIASNGVHNWCVPPKGQIKRSNRRIWPWVLPRSVQEAGTRPHLRGTQSGGPQSLPSREPPPPPHPAGCMLGQHNPHSAHWMRPPEREKGYRLRCVVYMVVTYTSNQWEHGDFSLGSSTNDIWLYLYIVITVLLIRIIHLSRFIYEVLEVFIYGFS